MTGLPGDGNGGEVARFHIGQHIGGHLESGRDVFAEQGRGNLMPAAVGRVPDFQAVVEALQQLGQVEALGGNGPGAAVDDISGVLLRGLDKGRKILQPRGLVDGKSQLHDRDLGHGLEVFFRKTHIGQLGRGAQPAECGKAQRIAVGPGAQHVVEADSLRAAGFIDHIDGDLEFFLEILRQDAAGDVHRAAGTEGHDDVQGAVLGVVGAGLGRKARQTDAEREIDGKDEFSHNYSSVEVGAVSSRTMPGMRHS